MISANGGNGIRLGNALGRTVQGNYIGTKAGGAGALGNGGDGVRVRDSLSAHVMVLGGSSALARNVISGNQGFGINLVNNTQSVEIEGNCVGVTANGSGALLNEGGGVSIDGTNNVVGGASDAAGNVISGNTGNGVQIVAGNRHTVQRNRIGLDSAGASSLPNNGAGVALAAGINHQVTANRIDTNGGLGIDLGPVGVTPNDRNDADGGARRPRPSPG